MIVVYPDVYFLLNFLMNMIVLETYSLMKNGQLFFLRCILAAILGAGTAVFFLWLKIANPITEKFSGLSESVLRLITSMIQMMGTALLMICILEPEERGRKKIKNTFELMLLCIVTGGIINWTYEYREGWKLAGERGTKGILMREMVIYGIGVQALLCTFHFLKNRKGREEKHFCRILLEINGEKARLSGLLDSGNLLKTARGEPVNILSETCLKQYFPSFHKGYQEMLEDGIYEEDKDKNDRRKTEKECWGWIPYQTIEGSGVLPVFLADRMTVCTCHETSGKKNAPYVIVKPKIGIAGKTFAAGKYQMIIQMDSLKKD